MADSYSMAKGGKLKLKGSKHKSHKKHKKHKHKREHEDDDPQQDSDSLRHGSWWSVQEFSEINGVVAIEMGNMRYIKAIDNGLFKVEVSHDIGEGPVPEEMLMAMRVSETKIALKSGYDKFLSVNTDGKVIGRSDAIGSREQWEPVFQEGNLALLGCNNCFMSQDTNGSVLCTSKTVGEDEILQIRSCAKKEKKRKTDEPPEEEKGSAKQAEINYVKKFQSFQDRRLRVNAEDRAGLKKARQEGTFHEAMLDRRAKMKADRYCK